MGLFLDQFIEAAREFHNRIPQPEKESRESSVVYYVMHFTGGSRNVKPLEPRDRSKYSWEEQKEMSMSDFTGYYSLEQVQSYLSTLIDKIGVTETFLIPALVRGIEGEFRYYVDNYENGLAKIQENIDEIRAIEADPERREVLLKAAREIHEQFIAEGKISPADVFNEETYFQRQVDLLNLSPIFKPDEKVKRETTLALWQDVTREMLTPENIEKAKADELEVWRRRAEGEYES